MQSNAVVRRNIFTFYLSYGIYFMASGILSESYIQAYLIGLGLDTRAIGVYGTAGMLAALLGYAMFSRWRLTSDGYLKRMFRFAVMMCVFPAALLAGGRMEKPVLVLCAGTAVYQMMAALRFSCEYCVVPVLFPRRNYGSLSARCGILGSALTVAISLVSALSSDVDPMRRYAAFFAVALGALLISALSTRLYRPDETLQREESVKQDVSLSLKRKLWLLLPHFLRGISTACFYYFVSIGFRNVTLSGRGQSLFITAGVMCTMGGCFLFMQLQKKLRTGTIILLSNLVSVAAAMAVCAVRTEAGFFAAYIAYSLFLNVTSYTIPAGVIYSYSSGELPFISSMRMFAMNGATCLLLTPMAQALATMPAWMVMAFGGAVYTASGAIFFIQYKDALRK